MYFTKVEIENYGCIKKFQYAFGFAFNMSEFSLITAIVEKIVNEAESQEDMG